MTTHEETEGMTPMSNRLSVLTALEKHGQSTYGELEFNTGLTRKQLLQAVNDAKRAGHIDSGKDDLTGQPAYSITAKGQEWKASMPQEVAVKTKIPTAVSLPPKAKAEPVTRTRTAFEIAAQTTTETNLRQQVAHLTDALAGEKSNLTKEQEKVADLKTMLADRAKSFDEACDTIKRHADLKSELETAETAVVRWLDLAREYECKSIPELRVFIGELVEWVESLRLAKSENVALKTLNGEMPGFGALHQALTKGPFVVRTPSKPPRFTKKQTSAHTAAMSAARQHGFAEVFALVPVGKAVRGAEWRAA